MLNKTKRSYKEIQQRISDSKYPESERVLLQYLPYKDAKESYRDTFCEIDMPSSKEEWKAFRKDFARVLPQEHGKKIVSRLGGQILGDPTLRISGKEVRVLMEYAWLDQKDYLSNYIAKESEKEDAFNALYAYAEAYNLESLLEGKH